MGAIDSQVDNTVNTKIGTNADAAGTSTLFARLNQIAGFTDQVEGFVDTLETNVGLNSDAAGTNTLFALLKKLDAKPVYTDILLTKAPYLSRLMANTGGGGIAIGNSVWTTLVDISGSGYVTEVLCHNGFNAEIQVKITIDGVLKWFNRSTATQQSNTGIVCRSAMTDLAFGGTTVRPYGDTTNSANGSICFISQPLQFNSQVKIEAYMAGSGYTVGYSVMGGM